MSIAAANATISVAAFIFSILGVFLYLLVGALIAQRNTITGFGFGLCLLAWPLVGLAYASVCGFLILADTYQQFSRSKCLRPPARSCTVPTHEKDGFICCTRCGRRTKIAARAS